MKILTSPGIFVDVHNAQPVEIAGFKGRFFACLVPRVQFGVHTGWRAGEWRIHESTSGCCLVATPSPSIEEAVKLAERVASTRGISQERLQRAIADTVRVFGPADAERRAA